MDIKTLKLSNGEEIKVGETLKLRNLIGEKYKQTKNYDLEVAQPIEIHKFDECDFKSVWITPIIPASIENFDIINFDPNSVKYERLPAHKLLSGFTDSILSIITSGANKSIVKTKYFEIDLEAAIQTDEVILIKSEMVTELGAAEETLMKNLRKNHEAYSLGIYTVDEVMEEFELNLHLYFQIQKKWKIMYAQSLPAGKYHRKKDD